MSRKEILSLDVTQGAQGVPEGAAQGRIAGADNEADPANTATSVLGWPESDWKRTAQPTHLLQESAATLPELHHQPLL
jgi:hypothetical protein